MRDSRYAAWLKIAENLEQLHSFAYGEGGYLARIRDEPFLPSPREAAAAIRRRCENGRWYWWDKGSLAGAAHGPLRSFKRVIGDAGGLYEESPQGRALIERIRLLDIEIATVMRTS